MEKNGLRDKIVSGLVWKFGERIVAQGVSFVISIVLARILAPEEYGTVALILVFINLANVFVTNGLGESLIQDKESNEKEFSTIFYCSLLFSAFLYAGLYLLAKPIADFYDNDSLVLLLRVLALQIPLSSVKTIQHAYVSKYMMFKKFFFSTLGGTLVSGVIGIVMAVNGFGVWALVEQYLVNSVIDMGVLFITVKWRPKLIFDSSSAKRLIKYGWKLMLAQFINTLYSELRSLIIGKKYSEADLAFYNRGNQFPSLIITNINASISSVLFPAMSSINDENARLKELTRKSMQLSSYIIFPMMTGMIAIANPLIEVLLTEKWLPAVPLLQICCLYWMFQPIQTANVQAIKAAGRSDLCLRLEIIKKIIGFGLLFASMNYGVTAIALSNTLFAAISMIINVVPNKTIIQYGYKEQVADILPIALLSGIMGACTFLFVYLPISRLLVLIIQLIFGCAFYIVGSKVMKLEMFDYIMAIIKKNK